MIELHDLSSDDETFDAVSPSNKTRSSSYTSSMTSGSLKELSLNFVSDFCV